MPDATPIDALRRASAVLLSSGDPAVWRVAQAIDTWPIDGGDFATALGLWPGWHSAMRQRERDRAIGELARQHYGALAGRALARALAAAGQRYEANAWQRNKAARYRPDGRDGLLHDVALRGGMPGESHLRRLLLCIGSSRQCK